MQRFVFFYLLLLLFSLKVTGTRAQEAEIKYLQAALKQLNIDPKDCYEDLVREKVLPYSPSESVLVIPKIAEQEPGESTYTFDSYILLINNRTGEIISTYFESNAWYSDALQMRNISIDTAPYNLNSKTRAFGINISYSGSSRPHPFESKELSLYVRNGEKLEQVLRNFITYRSSGSWDTHCTGSFEKEESVLIVSKRKTNNYNDLVVKTKVATIQYTPLGDDCKEEETPGSRTGLLRFNKEEYK